MRLPAFCRPSVPRRGVSLVEALVAMAVMSIGMLALVGVQGTMRLNSDLARQRTEATRIASEEIERVRSFTSLGVVASTPGVSYDEIVSRDVAGYQLPGDTANTSYQVQRTVRPDPNSGQKLITVRVRWTDRTNQAQTVTLDSSISASPPVLSAMLVVPHRESAVSRGRGRHISIPDAAVPVSGDSGRSRFNPPGASNVAWYFDNLTGLMRVCVGDVNDIGTCPVATLVSGTVRFHIASTQPTGANAEHPAGPVLALAAGPGALTLADAVGTGTAASCYTITTGQVVNYYCAVATSDAQGWGGQLNLVPDGWVIGLTASSHKTCRYTADLPAADISSTTTVNEADPNAEFTLNADHPRKYCLERPRNSNEAGDACTGKRVKVNLINQNFLVIRGDQTCPTEWDANNVYQEAGDPLIRANTRQHQPAP